MARRRLAGRRELMRDLRRRTEAPNGVVKVIIAYKAATALLLGLLGCFLLGLIVDHDWGDRVRELVMATGLRTDNRFLSDTLMAFGLLSRRTTTTLGLISMAYALLATTECIGLVDRRRWAEYLVLLATLPFLPYEAREFVHHATVGKLLLLVGNLAIAVYFIKRRRLFHAAEEEDGEAVTGPGGVPTFAAESQGPGLERSG